MVTVLEKVDEADVAASVQARSDAEAGIMLRFHSPDDYLVALYSPKLKALYIHDRKNGGWGAELGRVEVPDIGPRIELKAAVSGEYAAAILTDGTKTYRTPTVKVSNAASGKVGLWLFQIGDRQEYADFKLCRAEPGKFPALVQGVPVMWTDTFHAPDVPSPQDWVLVLERVK